MKVISHASRLAAYSIVINITIFSSTIKSDAYNVDLDPWERMQDGSVEVLKSAEEIGFRAAGHAVGVIRSAKKLYSMEEEAKKTNRPDIVLVKAAGGFLVGQVTKRIGVGIMAVGCVNPVAELTCGGAVVFGVSVIGAGGYIGEEVVARSYGWLEGRAQKASHNLSESTGTLHDSDIEGDFGITPQTGTPPKIQESRDIGKPTEPFEYDINTKYTPPQLKFGPRSPPPSPGYYGNGGAMGCNVAPGQVAWWCL